MKKTERPFAWTVDILRRAKLRPTCQRMGLVKLLFGHGHRHICAEELYKEAKASGMNLSLATVYNTLNQFKEAGLLREILTGSDKAYFDTNLTPHSHLFFETNNHVEDLPAELISVQLSEALLKKVNVKSVEVVVRI